MLASYILLIYEANKKSEAWLKNAMLVAQEEYLIVWMSKAHPHRRQVHKGLSRYYDINVLHDLAEAESGWDMTPRFERKALDFLPEDLNALLFKYEIDFSTASKILGDALGYEMWQHRAESRKTVINELMWSKTHHFYFDYNYMKESRGPIWSLASYFTMWAGLASQDQADYLVKHLSKFDCEGGLSTTSKTIIDISIFGSLKTQWAHPNGWAPLHFIVIEGLKKYGYRTQADNITRKWLTTNIRWFNKHGEFLEKYNVAEPNKKPLNGVYPTQIGFGWTNAIFAYLVNEQNLLN
jgi:alpha,alpha-trehalase